MMGMEGLGCISSHTKESPSVLCEESTMHLKEEGVCQMSKGLR